MTVLYIGVYTSFYDLLTWKDHPHLLSKHSITWTTSPLPTSIHCSWQIPWKTQWDSSKKNSGASYSKKPREAKQCLFFLLNVSTSKWRILCSQRNLLPEFQRWLRDALSSSENSFKLHNMLSFGQDEVWKWETVFFTCLLLLYFEKFLVKALSYFTSCFSFCALNQMEKYFLWSSTTDKDLRVKVQHRNSTFSRMIFLCESFMFGCCCENGR